jgi:CRISPR/Cas system-associated endoribonuclease Cas2
MGRKLKMAIGMAAVTIFLLGNTVITFADSDWAKAHPRRHQVNKRLRNQNKRIKNEVKEGEMSKGQAKNLHKDDKMIRQEERDMAKQNGGHITKLEQKGLNQQENVVSRDIGK